MMITQECWLTLEQLKSLVRTGKVWADSMDGGRVMLRVHYNESLKRVDELVRSEVEGALVCNEILCRNCSARNKS